MIAEEVIRILQERKIESHLNVTFDLELDADGEVCYFYTAELLPSVDRLIKFAVHCNLPELVRIIDRNAARSCAIPRGIGHVVLSFGIAEDSTMVYAPLAYK